MNESLAINLVKLGKKIKGGDRHEPELPGAWTQKIEKDEKNPRSEFCKSRRRQGEKKQKEGEQ